MSACEYDHEHCQRTACRACYLPPVCNLGLVGESQVISTWTRALTCCAVVPACHLSKVLWACVMCMGVQVLACWRACVEARGQPWASFFTPSSFFETGSLFDLLLQYKLADLWVVEVLVFLCLPSCYRNTEGPDQVRATKPRFTWGSEDLNMGPHVCPERTLPNWALSRCQYSFFM